MKIKLPYENGTWFAVPLRNGGFATGVVARHSPDGVILVYLFGPKRPKVARLDQLEGLTKAIAIKVSIAGDLGLLEGRWPIIGKFPSWQDSEWPMPKFLRKDLLGATAWLVTYAENNPNHVVSEEPVPFETTGFERDVLSGAGAVEIVLTRLLA
jgi:hypothetical protein